MRLITRTDFDGLICSTLLKYLGLVDDWKFIHPKDVQDGLVEANDNDIVVNVPYIKGCKLWFDHHSSEKERLGSNFQFEGLSKTAPSCARVIYEYYGGDEKLGKFAELVKYADKMDSADLTVDEITHPSGWVLLGFLVDPRTGLGRIRTFTVSNFELLKTLARLSLDKSIEEILELPDVRERIDVYYEQQTRFISEVKKRATVNGNVVIVDLRNVDSIPAGNRFLLYTLFPEQNISVVIVDGKQKLNSVVTVGYSIVNKTATVDVGSLMLKYGGGGHKTVGTCQIPNDNIKNVLTEIIDSIKTE
ncbi:MAG: exopolyphosphatase [Treponema sp.]|jgi:nanoRNase/pAp phosphatase (c-di-AMP/oligoRNAs hydrolase)|nr:exopolyphosphatase [Treponema sp.]